MPVIDIYTPLETPPSGLLRSISIGASEILSAPVNHAWVFWNMLKPQCYYRPDWLDQPDKAGPIVKIRCKSTYSTAQTQQLITRTATVLSDALEVRFDSVFVILDRVLPGQLLVNGSIWQDAVPNSLVLRPVGVIQNNRSDLSDDNWGNVISTIIVDSSWLDESALDGIEAFSHLEIIFFMHQVPAEKIPLGARHPRNLKHLPKVGILAQRPKSRPNQLGLSRCKLLSHDGFTLRVQGLDAVDGTPVLDIKPYYQAFGPRGEVTEPNWLQDVLKNYY